MISRKEVGAEKFLSISSSRNQRHELEKIPWKESLSE